MRSDNLAPISAENMAHLRALYGADRVVPCNAELILGAPNPPFVFRPEDGYQRTHARKVSQAFAKQNQDQERQK